LKSIDMNDFYKNKKIFKILSFFLFFGDIYSIGFNKN